jgi:Plasma-membrane choline transporter
VLTWSQDVWFLVAFVAHFVVLWFVCSGPSGLEQASSEWMTEEAAWSLGTNLSIAAVCGFFMGPLWMAIYSFDESARVLFWGQPVAAGLLVIHAALLFYRGSAPQWLLAAGLLVLVGVDWAWTARSQRRASFVTVLLQVIWGVLKEQSDLRLAMGSLMVAQLVYLLWWSTLLVGSLRSSGSAGAATLKVLLLLVSLRWTTGVLSLVAAITTAGSVASHLIRSSQGRGVALPLEGDEGLRDLDVGRAASSAVQTAEDDQRLAEVTGGAGGAPAGASSVAAGVEVRAPTTGDDAAAGGGAVAAAAAAQRSVWSFFRQAAFWSLGTACAGALLSMVSPPLWSLMRPLRWLDARRTSHPRLAALARAGLVFLRFVLRDSHRYAALRVALHGRAWVSAARGTWYLFEARGVEAVAASDPTGRLLVFGGYVGGSLMALVTGVTLNTSIARWILVAIVVFWIGFVSITLPQTLVGASSEALIACFAEVPEALSQCHPVLYHRFVRTAELRHHARATAVAARSARHAVSAAAGTLGTTASAAAAAAAATAGTLGALGATASSPAQHHHDPEEDFGAFGSPSPANASSAAARRAAAGQQITDVELDALLDETNWDDDDDDS